MIVRVDYRIDDTAVEKACREALEHDGETVTPAVFLREIAGDLGDRIWSDLVLGREVQVIDSAAFVAEARAGGKIADDRDAESVARAFEREPGATAAIVSGRRDQR